MATKQEFLDAETLVIRQLLRAGFTEFGRTDEYVVETDNGAVNAGNRKRYALPGSAVRATVGIYSTNFYRVENGEAVAFEGFRTLQEGDKISRKIHDVIDSHGIR